MPTSEFPPAPRQEIGHWVFGGIAFLIYCLTLNHWASLSNIGTISQVSGWSWQPELRQPITCAILFLFRLLPQAWLPLALNLFTAASAALILTLLARSVLLFGKLQYSTADRVHDSRSSKSDEGPPLPKGEGRGEGKGSVPNLIGHERTKLKLPAAAVLIPAILAITVCGLQLTFWEHATSFTGEMLDLLIFAYIIRCLLEFRNDKRESWLFRSSFFYGAGITNNWAMLGYLPLYLIAILFLKNFGFKRVTKPAPPRRPRTAPGWLRNLLAKIGVRQNAFAKPVYPKFRPVVFDTGFILRIAFWGLAGLSFYLLLPIVQSLSSHSSIGFWPALEGNLAFQKNALSILRSPAFRILAIASLLPLLVVLIGWKSQPAKSGYETRRAIFLNRLASHPLHAFVFLLAVWLSFDPTFSPRHLLSAVPMLTYYYLSALLVGYCAAYFLRIATELASKPLAKSLTLAICTSAIALPFLLLAKNFAQIRLTNGPGIHQLAREMYDDLPAGKSVVLGNDLAQLSFLRAELAANNHTKDTLIVELPSLASAHYHLFMARQYGHRWPVIASTNDVDLVGPIRLLKLISSFAEHEPVYYLAPSFGALFDRPNDSVNGFLHHFATQPETQELTSEALWQKRWTNHVRSLARGITAPPQTLPFSGTLRLKTEPNTTALFLATLYSRSLNSWGVQSQRLEYWPEAGVWFQRSLELNPQNLSARINLTFNEKWQRGDKSRLNPAEVQKQFPDLFSRSKDWRDVLSGFGPVDEPTFLFRTGRAYLANGNTRLAANAFQRSAELAPEWPQPKLWLAQSLIEQGNFADALNVTDRIATNSPPREGPGLAEFLHCRATSLWGVGRTDEVPAFIDGFVHENGSHREVLAAAANAYAEIGLHEQQLAIIEELLKREPNRSEWLSQKGIAEMQLGRNQAAIATFTAALSFAPTDENARLARAIAHLAADQLDAARDDYQPLLSSKSSSANALFGLGTIAWRKHDTNSAIAFYRQYVTNEMAASSQLTTAVERLREMGAR